MTPVPQKLLLSLASVSLVLLLLEGVFRLLPLATESRGRPVDDVLIPDRELIWRLNPQASGPFVTNELGLRDTPFQRDAEFKILLLGDSVSWGDGVRDLTLTYPWLLEQRLAAASGQTVEVINSAVPGWSTFQQLHWLRREGLELAPDLILLQFCLNDVVERYTALAEYGGATTFIGIDTRVAVRGLHGWLLRHSRAYATSLRLVMRRARNQQEYQVEKLTQLPLSPELSAAWKRVLSELDQIRALAAERRLPLVLLVMPYRFQLDQPSRTDQPQQVLREWADASGVPILDLLPPFAMQRARAPQTPLFFDPNHLTIEGHELVAELAAAPLLELLSTTRAQSNGQAFAR